MLIKPSKEEAEKSIDFAWELAQDTSRSGYPIYTDGIKTKKDFVDFCGRAWYRENVLALLYLDDGAVSGWIQFSFEKGSSYLQTEVFNIAGDTRRALEEFIVFCTENFAGYELYLGFPADNQTAIGCLLEKGWNCLERAFHDVIYLTHYEIQQESAEIVRVTKANFQDFRKLHEPIQEQMYWTCDRLYENLGSWCIWICYQEGLPMAAIYHTDEKIQCEIFGVDFKAGRYNERIFRSLLTKVLNECKRRGKKYMIFFNDDQTQQTALDIGFTCVGKYMLFAKNV